MATKTVLSANRCLRRLFCTNAIPFPSSVTSLNSDGFKPAREPAVMATRSAVSAHRCLRQLFSTNTTTFPSFVPSPNANSAIPERERAEPNPVLFVSGLSKRTTSEGLRDAFSKFGEVVHARIMSDRVSGYSKGYGFVKYATTEDAAKGIEGMDGKFLDGWVIFAEYARKKPDRLPPQQLQNSMPPPYGRQ